MLNSNTHKQRKRFQENRSRYLNQAKPDESVSSNTDLESQQPDIRVRLERPSKKKVSVKIRNLDIDSDIIKEEDSEDYISEKQSQDNINHQESNAVLNFILEEEIESPFKSRNNQNKEILWNSSNQEYSQQVEVQLFNTPKQHQKVDSPQIESAIKSYKNLNTIKSIYSPVQGTQKHKINDNTIYQHFNFFQRLFLYHIFCYMKQMKQIIESSTQKISVAHLQCLQIIFYKQGVVKKYLKINFFKLVKNSFLRLVNLIFLNIKILINQLFILFIKFINTILLQNYLFV